ncbi:tRNA (guanine-N(7)-)-methyltransferase non-catalytic subunit wdr4 [Pelmatolapia mariae]|uniref:tRNA (guanine-N(7)-)-methyltransferase non-catalytic subunit wdr4 n=1 Tax=Pelmatolapia mariae TaxID=158779 RepID=UPI002FE54DCE
MSAVGFCGNWIIVTCDKKLFAVHTKEARDPFVFDCSTAEKKPKNTKDEKNSDGGSSEETGSDKVLAFAVSPSGKLLALTDDTKRLVLFSCEPSWHCISIRWVVRRCTSLVFTQAEDELLVADKSGDVYAFSVVEPQKEGGLKMGHLSMLLALTVSLDDKYIITADRDEKIRVSHLRSPYNIQSFCLGHRQFVSALQILSTHPHWLLSGSGDGTLKLWDYESGSELQSLDLRQLDETTSSEADKDKDPTVCRITSSSDGQYVAVQCDSVPILQLFTLTQKGKEKLVPHSRISLPCCPLDVNFDPEGRLWVLMDSSDAPLQIYSLTHSSWECVAHVPELNRVTKAFRPHWETLEASLRTNNRFEQLHKVTFDNVAVYLQRKQERLEEQHLKRSGGQRAKGNKRIKKETEAVTQPFA